ncbi:MAG: glycosyltransferase family 2 protein [Chloroflexi bacterium]|nr:glycosyltransferase family 2 protein [Chloroflexota bacterium]
MITLSYAVLTLNEELDIETCLTSLGPAEEVLLLDSFSSDRTIERAVSAATRLHIPLRIEQYRFRNYAEQRNRALDLLTSEWVFFVDADEQSTPDQHQEVATLIESSAHVAGFWVPRRNFILGREIHHAGWFPDYQLRLFRRTAGRYREDRPVHELVDLRGEVGHLKQPLIHVNYRTFGELILKQWHYAELDAVHEATRSKPVLKTLLSQPVREFLRRYVDLEGWRDGGHGLLLSLVMAWYRFVVAYRAHLLAHRAGSPSDTERET